MIILYVELIKNDRCDKGVYIEEDICNMAYAPSHYSENIIHDIVDTSILDIMTSTPVPQCPQSP